MMFVLLAALESREDRGFFAKFYRKYNVDLYRYALSILGDPGMAEDAVQESWFRCVRSAEAFFSIAPSERKPWMVVIVKRVCLTILKEDSRTILLDEELELAAPERGSIQGILEIVRSMPEQYRDILELKYVLEWTDKDIAKAVDLPITTVRARIVRGKKLLREKLIKEGYWNESTGG